MKVNAVNSATAQAMSRAAELLRYQNKQMEIHRMDEALQQEKLRLERIKPTDPDRGQNVDITV